MNAERLLALFEEISGAPDAISRLRRFIVDMAVRGKLVDQDQEDEPAEELLKIVGPEKLRLGIKEARQRSRSAPINSYCDFSLPCGWARVAGSEVFPTRSGNSKLIKGKQHNKPFEGLYPGYSAAGQDVWLDTWEHEGDAIILSAVGARCGKAFLASGKWSAIANTHIIWVLPWITHPQYAMLLLNNEAFWVRSGGAQPFVKVRETLERQIGLPPLSEQHRIVAKVDELMALCDQLEAARQQREQCRERLVAASLQRLNQPSDEPEAFRNDARFALQVLPTFTSTAAQIKQLRQTILNLAVRGRLVEQDPEDEPAEELLAHVAEAKLERKRLTGDARIKIEQDPSPDSLPMSLPESWECQSFQNLFLFIDYRGNTPPKTSEGVPLITAKNIRMGHLDREPREYVSPQTFEAWMTRGFPRLGDLFLTMEAPLGNVCVNTIEEPFALAQRVVCLQPYAEIDTQFVMYALMSSSMQEMVGEQASGLTAKGIKAAKLKPLPIPLPPLAEQHRIVAKVDELMALCDQLEQQLSQAEKSRRELLEAVLREALVGRLPERPEEHHAAIA